jgi:predicted phage terminase large subunit-like protein
MRQNPKTCVVAASHTQELADSFGRKVRNLLADKGHILDLFLSPDSQSANRWNTLNGDEYFAVGVGGAVTGRRADLIVIDDGIKSKDDADSQLVRDRQWDWFQFDIQTRLKPGARVAVVNTRWHEDDLSGRLLDPKSEHYNEDEAKKWTVLNMPMEAESANDPLGRKPGELLWPGWFTSDMVTTAKRNPRLWSALYQQRPSPEEGGFFKKDWLHGYQPSELPTNLRCYLASDHAVSMKQTADKTCIISAGVCENGYIWILPDTYWQRADSEQVVDAAINLCRKRKPLTWFAERGHITQSIGPFLRKRMRELGVFTNIDERTPAKDKQTRAQSIHGRMSMGMVKFPKFAPWWADMEHELLSFPAGAHDDAVDALSWLGIGLENLAQPGRPGRARQETRPKPFTGQWLNESEERQKRQRWLEQSTAGW